MNVLQRLVGVACLGIAGLLSLTAPAQAQEEARGVAWSEHVVELTASLPVQDGGRVKPLHTFASVMMLRLNGKRSLKLENGETLGPTEWMLDVLIDPGKALEYRSFMIQHDGVLSAIGVDSSGRKKRDRYSFNELRPGLARLFELAEEYRFIEEKDRSTVQQQVFLLAGNVDIFMGLVGHFDFARRPLPVPPGGELAELFDGRTEVRYSDVVANGPAIEAIYTSNTSSAADRDAALMILRSVTELAQKSESLALVPPVDTSDDVTEWMTPGDILAGAMREDTLAPEHLELLRSMESWVGAYGDDAGFEAGLGSVHTGASRLAERRGEYDKIGLELTYYRAKLVSRSLVLFIFAFVLSAFMWMRPKGWLLYLSTWGLVSVGTLGLTTAIVMRCIIRSRPPVSTLYETVLFVSAVGLIVALFIELVGRKRIAISAAAFLGMVGMFVANGYELLDKKDTMPSLVAVLDTNFWLATHVTSITIGYSAGMLAALLGSIYILAKIVRFRGGVAGDRLFYSNLARMVYGVLCFGLIFSVVGTILGGIWANDSWGRFWGWDPKENGALLIVISQITILHARMGGYLKQHGVCMAAAFGGTVVAFSWWGVNLLGVGLHSYGFTSGIHSALWTYYGIQWAIVGLGFVASYLEQRARPIAA